MTRFGVLCSAGSMNRGNSKEGLTYQSVQEIARATEESGFDTVLLPDEAFISKSPQVECWVTLSALAKETKRIRIGPYVTCNGYRHPAILAKMAATLDDLSGGRLEFYLGAGGWGQIVVHRAFGLEYPNLRGRVGRLKESIQLIRAMWTQRRANFQGRYYSLRNAICEPKPVQRPMRIWTGGSTDILIECAAQVADGWDTGFCTLDGFKRMSAKLDKACENAGRKPKEVKRSMHWHTTLIGRNKSQVDEKKKRYLSSILEAKSKHPTRLMREMPVDEYVKRRILVGTPQEIADQLCGFIDYGCDSLNFVFPDATEVQPIQLFADGVLSKLG